MLTNPRLTGNGPFTPPSTFECDGLHIPRGMFYGGCFYTAVPYEAPLHVSYIDPLNNTYSVSSGGAGGILARARNLLRGANNLRGGVQLSANTGRWVLSGGVTTSCTGGIYVISATQYTSYQYDSSGNLIGTGGITCSYTDGVATCTSSGTVRAFSKVCSGYGINYAGYTILQPYWQNTPTTAGLGQTAEIADARTGHTRERIDIHGALTRTSSQSWQYNDGQWYSNGHATNKSPKNTIVSVDSSGKITVSAQLPDGARITQSSLNGSIYISSAVTKATRYDSNYRLVAATVPWIYTLSMSATYVEDISSGGSSAGGDISSGYPESSGATPTTDLEVVGSVYSAVGGSWCMSGWSATLADGGIVSGVKTYRRTATKSCIYSGGSMICTLDGDSVLQDQLNSVYTVYGVDCSGGIAAHVYRASTDGHIVAVDTDIHGSYGVLSHSIEWALPSCTGSGNWFTGCLGTVGLAVDSISIIATATLTGGTQDMYTYTAGGWQSNGQPVTSASMPLPVVSPGVDPGTIVVTAFVGGSTIISSGAHVIIGSSEPGCSNTDYDYCATATGQLYYAEFSATSKTPICTAWSGATATMTYHSGGSYWIEGVSAFIDTLETYGDGGYIDHNTNDFSISCTNISSCTLSNTRTQIITATSSNSDLISSTCVTTVDSHCFIYELITPYIDGMGNVFTILRIGQKYVISGTNLDGIYQSCYPDEEEGEAGCYVPGVTVWDSSTVSGGVIVSSASGAAYRYTYNTDTADWVPEQSGAPTPVYTPTVSTDNSGGVLITLLSGGSAIASASGNPSAHLVYYPQDSQSYGLTPIGSAAPALTYYDIIGTAICTGSSSGGEPSSGGSSGGEPSSGGSSSGESSSGGSSGGEPSSGTILPAGGILSLPEYQGQWGIADAAGKEIATINFLKNNPAHGDIIDINGQYAGCLIGRTSTYAASSYLSGGDINVFLRGLPKKYTLNQDTLIFDIGSCSILTSATVAAPTISSIELPPDCHLSIDANACYYLEPDEQTIPATDSPLRSITFKEYGNDGNSVTISGTHLSIEPYCIADFSGGTLDIEDVVSSGGGAYSVAPVISNVSNCGIGDVVVTNIDGAIIIATHGSLNSYE